MRLEEGRVCGVEGGKSALSDDDDSPPVCFRLCPEEGEERRVEPESATDSGKVGSSPSFRAVEREEEVSR